MIYSNIFQVSNARIYNNLTSRFTQHESREHRPNTAIPLCCYLIPVCQAGLRQLTLDQALNTTLSRPDLGNLQPSRFHKRVPVTRRALRRRKVCHHDNVQTGSLPVGISLWDDILIDQNLAVSTLHSGYNILQDLLAVLGGPVVKHGVHVVGASSYKRVALALEQIHPQAMEVQATFDGLLGKEIMLHQLNRRMQRHRLGLTKYFREILQNQAAPSIGPLATELGEVMAHTAAHIHQESIFLADVRVDHTRHIVEAQVHPAGAALTVGGHVVVELAGGFGVVFEEFKEVHGCVEAKLERTVCTIGRGLVAGLLELGGEGEDPGCNASGPDIQISR